jgi:hypothetical protein
VRHLYKGHQLRGPKRTDERNLTQNLHGLMSSALSEEFTSHCAPQGLQSIQLLIEQLCTAAHPGLGNFI